MSDVNDSAEKLLRASVTASDKLARLAVVAPEVGDLFVLEATREQPVQWLLVDRRGELDLVAPVDSCPYLSTTDVRVEESTTQTPLVARTASATWIPRGSLTRDGWCGRLAKDGLDAVCSLRREIGERSVESTPQDTVVASELRGWIERVVSPACDALPRVEERRSPRYAQMASAALVLVAIGLTGLLLRERGRVERLLAERAGSESVVELGAPKEASEAPPPTRAAAEAVRAVPLVLLTPWEAERGGPSAFRAAAEEPSLFVALQLDPLRLVDRYTVQVEELATGLEVWSGGDFRREGRLRIDLSIPASLVRAGEYRIVLYPDDEGEVERVSFGEYRFSVAVNGSRAP